VSSAGRMQRVRRSLYHRTVPALVTELMSTLAQRHLSSFAGGYHRVRVALTERPLTRRQARNPVADDAGSQRDD